MAAARGYWAKSGKYPPRTGNKVQILIDGEDSFRLIAEDIEAARSYIYITGAFINLEFRPRPHTHPQQTIRQLLLERVAAGVRVYIHFWNPNDRLFGHEVLKDSVVRCDDTECLAQVNAGPGCIIARWDDAPGGMVGCHHQKTFVMDGRLAWVGGINSVQNYWDTPRHDILDRGRLALDGFGGSLERILKEAPPLHDSFMRLDGPCVADVEDSFIEYWNYASKPGKTDRLETTGRTPRPHPDGVEAQVVRTIGKKANCKPKGEQGIREFYLNAVSGAKKIIYLENQYFYDEPIVMAMQDALEENEDLHAIILLCAKPDTGLQRVFTLAKASRKMRKFFDKAFGEYKERIAFYSLLASQEIDGKPVYCDMYLHGKVGIFDDEWLTIGSANVNSFSMEKHSEMNVIVRTPAAGDLRRHLWMEHLGQNLAPTVTPREAAMLWDLTARSTRGSMEMGTIPSARILPFRPPYTMTVEA